MIVTEPPILKTIDIGDTEIPCLFYDGSGPTIVFLHATGFLPWLWHPIARELAGRFKIIAPYFCDHRDVDPDNGGLNWLVLAEDLTRLCQNLDLNSPHMVGHSMGGAIMTIAAGKFRQSVENLMLIEPIFLPRNFYHMVMKVEDHPLAGKSINRRNNWAGDKEAKDYLKSKKMFQSWDNEMLDLYIQYGMKASDSGGLELTCHPQKEAALFMGSMGYDPWPILNDVTCPVCVLEGEFTENKAFIDYPVIADTFPDGTYRMVKDAGHLVPMEKPKETVAIIREFFETDNEKQRNPDAQA